MRGRGKLCGRGLPKERTCKQTFFATPPQSGLRTNSPDSTNKKRQAGAAIHRQRLSDLEASSFPGAPGLHVAGPACAGVKRTQQESLASGVLANIFSCRGSRPAHLRRAYFVLGGPTITVGAGVADGMSAHGMNEPMSENCPECDGDNAQMRSCAETMCAALSGILPAGDVPLFGAQTQSETGQLA